jgi:hypothetical protein
MTGVLGWLDRNLWVVDLLLLAVLGMFVAAGVDRLLSARIDEALHAAQDPPEPRPPSRRAARQEDAFVPADGGPILERNIFDSTTGPITGEATEPVEEPVEESGQPAGTAEPEPCAGPLSLVAAYACTQHPELSFVAVRNGRETEILEPGDTIEELELVQVGWRLAFLVDTAGAMCYLDVFGEPAGGKGKKKHAAHGKSLPALLAKGVKKKAPRSMVVDGAIIEYLSHHPAELRKSARLMPNMVGKKRRGYKLYGIKKNSLWNELGLRNGDVIVAIDGAGMKRPNDLFRAVLGSKKKKSLHMKIRRHGKVLPFEYEVK